MRARALTWSTNRAGMVTSQVYPSGHTVLYAPDAAGRLASFTGNLGDGAQRTYSAGISYDAASRMKEEQFGTLTPLYHKLHYNVRGQLYDVRLSTAAWQQSGAGEWDWNRGALINYYSQNDINATTNAGRAGSGPENNGNLKRADAYVPTAAGGNYDGVNAPGSYFMAQSSYAYDALNRLSSVTETNNAGAGAVSQAYTYDRWGNRQINAAGTSAGVNSRQFTIDAATNRLTAAGMSYDAAGNLTQDTYSASAAQRTYDAENRMTLEQNSATSVFSRYTYDAGGKRVRRDLGGVVTWQVYGFSGELLAEYAGGALPASPRKEYGYRGGELLVTAEPGSAAGGVNVASAAQGAAASASFFDPDGTFGAGRHTRPADAIDGTRYCTDTAGTGYWRSHPLGSQWLRVDFAGQKTVGEVDVYTVRDDYPNQSDPSAAETFTLYGASAYTVEYWTGSAWAQVPGASVTGNNLVWRKFTFAPVSTTAIKVTVTGAADGVARIAEVEAYTAGGAAAQLSAFVTSFYTSILNRQPTSGELSSQVSTLTTAMGQGQTAFFNAASTLGQSLFLSQEYANRNRSDHWFVYDLYAAFNAREPDAAGWAAWEAGVPSQGREANVYGFSSSGNGEWVARSNSQYAAAVAAQGGGGVNWLVSDHLGTPRMVVDQTGSLAGVKRHDYLPFGEELPAGQGGRTSAQGYAADSLRQKYTGYERDAETGLNFAEARYHSDTQGRFTSIDPLSASAKLTDPQSLNRYAYVGNRLADGGRGRGKRGGC
ncbi:MAG: DUF4214 domain-containing protein [Acidobacteria bacterium]|nr:DUF4214 domain-containing protein [Acidobacteriota bacterium]